MINRFLTAMFTLLLAYREKGPYLSPKQPRSRADILEGKRGNLGVANIFWFTLVIVLFVTKIPKFCNPFERAATPFLFLSKHIYFRDSRRCLFFFFKITLMKARSLKSGARIPVSNNFMRRIFRCNSDG